ncbi:membrane metallo-endopeptidase-like 1 [Orussus abietinus]|uniref:membrane metallo-endopeptidase-like 1 n=1 Tax=Orussus abietinus TaxID=222816 RepID=UPI0006267B4B|nr:membrane metallo-endopeptidase-like 1 [Orussus abietinus]
MTFFLSLQFIVFTSFFIALALKPKPERSTKSKVSQINPLKIPSAIDFGPEIVRNQKGDEPCDDFYEYACGNWRELQLINDSVNVLLTEHLLKSRNKERIRDIFEKIHSNAGALGKAKQWMDTCLNDAEIDKAGLSSILFYVNKKGGWPMTMTSTEWNPNTYSWHDIDEYYTRLTGSSAMYNITIRYSQYSDRQNKMIIALTYPNFMLPLQNYLLSGKYESPLGKYNKNILKVMTALMRHQGTNEPDSLTTDVSNIVIFEKHLVELRRMFIQNPEKSSAVVLTLDQLQQRYNLKNPQNAAKIDWLKKVNNLLKVSGVRVTGSEKVYIHELEYFLGLPSLLNTVNPRILVNYIHWRFVGNMLKYSIGEFWQKFGGKMDRWTHCLQELPIMHPINYKYTKNYISDSSVSIVTNLAKRIQEQLERKVMTWPWLPDVDKKALLRKVKNIKIYVNRPSWYSISAINEYYSDLTIGSDHLKNMINCKEHDLKKQLALFTKPLDDVRESIMWNGKVIIENAFYHVGFNTIAIPGGLFQWPYFATDAPMAMLYGAIGYIIGHELSHSLDTKGRKYNEHCQVGNWWSKRANIMFIHNAKCLIDQFKKYDYPEAGSQRTVDENFADSLGLELSFQALMTESNTRSKSLRKQCGLEQFTNEQLFFLSFANTMCAYVKPDFWGQYIKQFKKHPPPKLRVLGSVSNSKDFSKYFSCPSSSNMNPERKCSL